MELAIGLTSDCLRTYSMQRSRSKWTCGAASAGEELAGKVVGIVGTGAIGS